jgi:polyphosphate kinase
VRREKKGLRTYAHLSTGNYNETTARIYTDFGLLSSREDLSFEAAAVFNYLTGYSHQTNWSKIIVAPVSLRQKTLALIQRVKMNSIVDAQVIRALYRASQAGVKIELVIRGICCLKPGVPGLSDNIRVMSIVGRFLEHTRVFVFENDGDPEIYFSSADWMPRNLNRRVEAMFMVEEPIIKERVLNHIVPTILADNVKSYILQPDASYVRPDVAPDEERVNSQERFIQYAETAYRERNAEEDDESE